MFSYERFPTNCNALDLRLFDRYYLKKRTRRGSIVSYPNENQKSWGLLMFFFNEQCNYRIKRNDVRIIIMINSELEEIDDRKCMH